MTRRCRWAPLTHLCVSFVCPRVYFLRQGASFLSAGRRGGQRRAECLVPVRRHRQSLGERALPPRGERPSSFYYPLRQNSQSACQRPANRIRLVAFAQRGGAGRRGEEEKATKKGRMKKLFFFFFAGCAFSLTASSEQSSESYYLHAQPLAKLPQMFLYKLLFAQAFLLVRRQVTWSPTVAAGKISSSRELVGRDKVSRQPQGSRRVRLVLLPVSSLSFLQ